MLDSVSFICYTHSSSKGQNFHPAEPPVFTEARPFIRSRASLQAFREHCGRSSHLAEAGRFSESDNAVPIVLWAVFIYIYEVFL